MSTITIELPDEIAAHLATPEGVKWARKAVMDAYEELQSTEGAERDELIATVNAGIASIEAGERGYTPEEQDALMLEKFPFLKAHRQTKV
jgi:predicted transcriptional regulator